MHECTINEIEAAFGTFRASGKRPRLFEKLRSYVAELPSDFTISAGLPPAAYNALSRLRVEKSYGFDMVLVPEQSAVCQQWIEFFIQVKGIPGRQKGILTVRL